MDERPIGLFDSGLGGLTVMREIVRLLPNENLIYLGDTGRLPYGNKSSDAIIRFSLDNSTFLLEKEIKLLIVACNTASTQALEILKQQLPVHVIGVVDCAISQLVNATKINKIAVLGTKGTIASGVHKKKILELRPKISVYPIACPLFVPLVEEGWLDHEITEAIAKEYLQTVVETQVDAALLACTHYPLIQKVIQKVLGPNILLIEPAKACAQEALQYLTAHKLLNQKSEHPDHSFYCTDAPDPFRKLASLFFGTEINEVKLKLLSS